MCVEVKCCKERHALWLSNSKGLCVWVCLRGVGVGGTEGVGTGEGGEGHCVAADSSHRLARSCQPVRGEGGGGQT